MFFGVRPARPEPIDYSSVSNLDQPRAPASNDSPCALATPLTRSTIIACTLSHRTALSKGSPPSPARPSLVAWALGLQRHTSRRRTQSGRWPRPTPISCSTPSPTRFNQVELAPKYDAARVRARPVGARAVTHLRRHLVWEARPSAATRLLYVSGDDRGERHYRLEPRPTLTPPARPGDTRHTIALEQLAPSVYRWDTNVDLAHRRDHAPRK